jgi:hypothetical protein
VTRGSAGQAHRRRGSDVPWQSAPDICVSRPGFDRVAFQQTFNREVVRFFEQQLE